MREMRLAAGQSLMNHRWTCLECSDSSFLTIDLNRFCSESGTLLMKNQAESKRWGGMRGKPALNSSPFSKKKKKTCLMTFSRCSVTFGGSIWAIGWLMNAFSHGQPTQTAPLGPQTPVLTRPSSTLSSSFSLALLQLEAPSGEQQDQEKIRALFRTTEESLIVYLQDLITVKANGTRCPELIQVYSFRLKDVNKFDCITSLELLSLDEQKRRTLDVPVRNIKKTQTWDSYMITSVGQ